jgi:DtxR family Mn-dependent transcriptional regulator
VHEVAEDLEHVSNKKLIDKLDEFLGFPRVDPHGDPIPDQEGRIETSRQVCLRDLPLNKLATVSHVSDQSSGILELLKHKHIGIGTKLEVKKKFDFDQSMEIKMGRQPVFTISEQLAKNIFVKYGT